MTEGLDYAAITALAPPPKFAAADSNVQQEIDSLSPDDKETFFEYLSKIVNNFLR
jgi:hypothetical protein